MESKLKQYVVAEIRELIDNITTEHMLSDEERILLIQEVHRQEIVETMGIPEFEMDIMDELAQAVAGPPPTLDDMFMSEEDLKSTLTEHFTEMGMDVHAIIKDLKLDAHKYEPTVVNEYLGVYLPNGTKAVPIDDWTVLGEHSNVVEGNFTKEGE